ncbi:HEPN domain-containing protein [Devosia sp.]|uniref:HEPN domain-containing protein n=1 Tax=Devosia sp. TaxID=1871048 RepID=UPI001ACA8E88|nr:HEPN domain-containing protein [Devosia sp.]MBN9309718.1 HEPN domain-containing protein [Devosia sp.]
MIGDKARSLVQLSEEECSAAAILLSSNPRQSMYLASQAAEKAARAVCEQAGVPVGISHNLGQIANLLPSTHALRPAITALDYLSSASTKYRYPTVRGDVPKAPTTDELQRAVQDIQTFIAKVKAHLGLT